MSTMTKLKNAKDKLQEAQAAMPGDYESQYTGSVNERLNELAKANADGFDYNTGADSYQKYLQNAGQNAQAGAQAAAATAQALGGGTDWTQSAAQQAAGQKTASAGTALADLRSKALQKWQNELSGNAGVLDTLLNQDSIERNAAAQDTANAQTWRDYLSSRVDQARQENSDFWSNAWNVVKNIGSVARAGYDGYMGYTQQQWENQFNQDQFDFQKQQYADSLNRTQLSDQIAAMEQAQAFKQAGFDELANQTLAKYGLDSTMLDAWQGMTDTQKDQMAALLQGASLAGSGNDTAAKNYLQMAGLDAGSTDSYATIAGRQNNNNLAYQQALLQLQ